MIISEITMINNTLIIDNVALTATDINHKGTFKPNSKFIELKPPFRFCSQH
jgi:hypothetical protein